MQLSFLHRPQVLCSLHPFHLFFGSNLSLPPPPPFLLDLLALLEVTFVLGAVGICQGTPAVNFVLLVFTLVLLAVGPGVGALAVLLVVLPLTLIDVAVCKSEGALAVLQAVLPATLVLVAACIGVGALAVWLAVLPVTLVLFAVGPGLGALAVSAISFDALAFRPLLFHMLCVAAGLQRRASSAPHRHWALCIELQLIFHL